MGMVRATNFPAGGNRLPAVEALDAAPFSSQRRSTMKKNEGDRCLSGSERGAGGILLAKPIRFMLDSHRSFCFDTWNRDAKREQWAGHPEKSYVVTHFKTDQAPDKNPEATRDATGYEISPCTERRKASPNGLLGD